MPPGVECPAVSAHRLRVSRIEIFPIKSLDPMRLDEASITPGGILENDRVYAIVDSEGRVVNGKRTEQVHRIRSSFDPAIKEVCLWRTGESSPTRFNLSELAPIDRWLSDFFGFPVSLHYDPVKGFPDDNLAFGPTLVSEASLRRVQQWYTGWTLESTRRRFRTNVELDGGEPFCEDELFGPPDELKPFQIGSVRLLGHNPCQRCIVPTRDPESGNPVRGFQKTFAELRKENLPRWADSRRFNHFYRFAVNTSIPTSESGKRLRIGDELAF